MATIADAENAFLEANADLQSWRAEFLDEWYEPLRQTLLLAFWRNLTPEQRAYYMSNHPEAYVAVQEWIKRVAGSQAID